MTALLDLIQRLEAAQGPDRELDARIYCVVEGLEFDRLAFPDHNSHDEHSFCFFTKDGRRFTCWANSACTRSVDAALTLLLEGWLLHIWDRVDGTRDAVLWRDQKLAEGQHPTSRAIALTIAALKSRLALQGLSVPSRGGEA